MGSREFRVCADMVDGITLTIWTGTSENAARRVKDAHATRKRYARAYIEVSDGYEGISRKWVPFS